MFESLNKGISTPIAIIIIVVLAALVGVVVWQYRERPAEEKEISEEMIARDEKRTEDLDEIRMYLDMYYLHVGKGKFPQDLNQLLRLNQKLPGMVESIPRDPKTNQMYEYKVLAGKEDFELCANLEASPEKKCLSSQLGSKEQKEKLLEEAEKVGGRADVRKRDAHRITDLNQIRTALELKYNDLGSYPTVIYGESGLAPDYLDTVLRDPLTNETYFYYLCPDGSYHLGAKLEDENSSYLNQDNDATKCSSDDFSGQDPIYDIKSFVP